MRNKLATAAFVLCLTATHLSAAEPYVGAGFGGEIEGGSFRRNLESAADADGDAWKIFAGVRLGRHFAVEVSRHDLGTQLCCRDAADLGFTSTVDGFSASALGRWPLGRFVPFVRAGVLAWEEDGDVLTLSGTSPDSADGTDLLLGAGVDVDLVSRLAVRAEWERYKFDTVSTDGFWASLLLRF